VWLVLTRTYLLSLSASHELILLIIFFDWVVNWADFIGWVTAEVLKHFHKTKTLVGGQIPFSLHSLDHRWLIWDLIRLIIFALVLMCISLLDSEIF
jgi:hypothetical protein